MAKKRVRPATPNAGASRKPLDQERISSILGSTLQPVVGSPFQTYMRGKQVDRPDRRRRLIRALALFLSHPMEATAADVRGLLPPCSTADEVEKALTEMLQS